jgi:hypothetical protein
LNNRLLDKNIMFIFYRDNIYMPKPSKASRRYKKRKTTKGGCGCNQKGGYSLRKLSIKKSLRKSLSKKSKKPIIMKGGLGGVGNTALDFGTLGGAATTSGVITGSPFISDTDQNIAASNTLGGNNANSLPMV